ncbi:N-acetyltransferase [bacterium]|nr:MAG: N-acetyltransferase [bacterium]
MEWPVLEGSRLVMSPTVLQDAEALRETVDETTYRHFVTLQPKSLSGADFQQFVQEAIDVPNARPYTIRLKETGEVVGCSSYMDIRAAARGLEIGLTWIAPKWRGTFVNPEAKYLMLRHAFEVLACIRVQLKCDARNEHSAAAIKKLGAQYEGRLRKHGIQPDGYIRDTLMFSIVDDEWPQVRAGLESRLVG